MYLLSPQEYKKTEACFYLGCNIQDNMGTKLEIYLILVFQRSVGTKVLQERNLKTIIQIVIHNWNFPQQQNQDFIAPLCHILLLTMIILSGSLIDPDNFNKTFGVLYFDLRNQEEDLKDSVFALTFRYQMNGVPAAKLHIKCFGFV